MVIRAHIHPFPIGFECDYKLCSRIHIRLFSMILSISVAFSRVVRSEYSRDASYSQCFENALEKKPPPHRPSAPSCPPSSMYSQRQPSGSAPSARTQSSMNQDSGARRPLSSNIPQTPSGLRGAGPQRQFHRSSQSGSPPLPSQGIIRQGNPHTPQLSQRGFGMRGGPDASGLDNSFGPTMQQRDRSASVSMNLA